MVTKMIKKAIIGIGSYTEKVEVEEIRDMYDDLVFIITKDGRRITTHHSNVVVCEEPEAKDSCKRQAGVWVINPDGWHPHCNICGYIPERPAVHSDNRTPYCPNCGAEMRKEWEGNG